MIKMNAMEGRDSMGSESKGSANQSQAQAALSLKEEILKAAKEEAQQILQAVEREEKEELSKLHTKLKNIEKAELAKYKEELAEKEKEAIARARLEGKRAIAEKKEELFRQALNDAVEAFLKSEDYKEYIKRALDNVKGKETSEKSITIVCNKADKKLIKSLANNIFKKVHIKTELDDRGIKIKPERASYVYDYTLKTLLSNKEDELRKLFYSKAFENE